MDEELLESKISKHRITGFYYFSLIDNFKNIIENGILSKNTIEKRKIPFSSFANMDVQNRRDNKVVDIYIGRNNTNSSESVSIHDLVPLYFTPRTPTLYAVRELHPDMFFIQIDTRILCDASISYCFTDGNAASKNTNSFNKIEDLDNLFWQVIHEEFWNEFEDGKRIRNSEMLIHPFVSPIWFKKIVTSNSGTKAKLQYTILNLKNSQISNLRFEVKPNYFFL